MSSVAPSILTSNAPRKRNPVIQIALQGGEQRRSGPQYALRGGALVHGEVKARVSEINLVYLGVWETIRIAVPTPLTTRWTCTLRGESRSVLSMLGRRFVASATAAPPLRFVCEGGWRSISYRPTGKLMIACAEIKHVCLGCSSFKAVSISCRSLDPFLWFGFRPTVPEFA